MSNWLVPGFCFLSSSPRFPADAFYVINRKKVKLSALREKHILQTQSILTAKWQGCDKMHTGHFLGNNPIKTLTIIEREIIDNKPPLLSRLTDFHFPQISY